MTELWRRLILVAGVTLTVCMFLFADLSPRVSVESVDFKKEQKHQLHFMGFISEHRRYLASLPLKSYIKKVVAEREIEKSAAMSAFAARVDAALNHPSKDAPWQNRLGSGPRLWFKLRSPPFRKLAQSLASSHQHILYLPYEKDGKRHYLRLKRHTYTVDDFALGTGYRGITPPTRLFYPLRGWAWLTLLMSLLGYFWLPWPKKEEDTLRVSRSTIVLGDVVSLLFFALFFSLPFFICGAVQAVGCWGILAIFLWPFSLAGLWMLKINAQYAAFVLRFIPGGFRLRSLSLDEEILYSRLDKVTPAVLKVPRWLGVLTGVAALFSRGADQVRMAGQSLLLSSAGTGGLRFSFRDGRAFSLWCQDQRGNPIVKGLPRLLDELKTASVFKETKPEEVKGIASDIVTWASRKKGKMNEPRPVRPMLRFCGVPLVIVLVFIFWNKVSVARDDTFLVKNTSPWKAAGKRTFHPDPDLPLLKRSEIVWRKTVGGGQIVIGEDIIRPGNGDTLVAGKFYKKRSDILLVRVDGKGSILWEKTYGNEADERPAGLTVAKGGAFVIAGTRGPRMYGNVYLFKVNGNGTVLWEKTWGEKYTDEVAEGVARTKDGTLAVIVAIKDWPTLVLFSSEGHFLSRQRLSTGLPGEKRLSAREILALPDGSLVVCGTVERTGAGFQDAFLMKLDVKGNRIWVRTYGGEGKEGANAIRLMPDGGFLLTGGKGFSGSGARNLWLIRTDARGELQWEKTFRNADDEKGTAAVVLPDGEVAVLGYATLPHTSVSYSTLRRIDARGNILWQRWLGRGVEIYAMAPSGAKACLVTGEALLEGSSLRKTALVVMKTNVK